jgi:hypothetical protein
MCGVCLDQEDRSSVPGEIVLQNYSELILKNIQHETGLAEWFKW